MVCNDINEGTTDNTASEIPVIIISFCFHFMGYERFNNSVCISPSLNE